ncbi:MAG: flippase-like domain-containing protein [Planctomycetes bacterium]|nr:flippase-like domain-containing protein [Planctomycetota bacterium]
MPNPGVSGGEPLGYNSRMNLEWKQWLVTALKMVAAVAVLFFVGRRFHADLENLETDQLDLDVGWLIAAAGFYLLAMLPSAWFWRHVHGVFGYPMSLYAGIRAHFIGQLGKYVPGKAMAVIIRSHLVQPFGIPYGVSVITSFYEVFTGMTSGAIIAGIVYLFDPPGDLGLHFHPLAIGAVLIGLCGIPLIPGVFNFVIARMTENIQTVEEYRLPPMSFGTLVTGLLATGAGWWLQGLSVWATLQAIVPNAPEFSLSVWAQCTAGIGFATVVGFALFFIPAGLGVREDVLKNLLSGMGAPAYIAIAVLLVRLTWVAAEAAFAACTYWVRPAGERSEPAG